MCSIESGVLGRICRAIEELAARPEADLTPGPDGGAAARDTEPRADDDIARLAAIWKMIADADPELAKRLPGYLTAAE
jgi:hypothetical protein